MLSPLSPLSLRWNNPLPQPRGVLCLLLLLSCASPALGYVEIPWPSPSSSPLNVTMGYATVKSTGTRFNWFSAYLDDLSRFTVALPLSGGCSVRQTTTQTAVEHNCSVGSNAGYFQFTPKPTYCLGQLVINGSAVEWEDDGNPLVAVTAQQTTIFGSLTLAEAKSLNVTYGVSGFGLLVLDGAVSAEGVRRAGAAIRARRPDAEEIAPRTVVALDAQGRMLLVAIDGVEDLLLGLTLAETAEIFASGAPGFPYIAAHALNLDGGGSTTFDATPGAPAPAQLFNRPTDTDAGPISERNVTSTICIK